MLLYGWVLFFISHYPAKCGVHRRCEREDISFLACQATSDDYIFREACEIGRVFLVLSDYHAKFGDHGPFGKGDMKI